MELTLHLSVVTGHDHLALLRALGEVDRDGNIRGPQEHLGAVVSVESCVATALLLGEDVEGGQELALCLGGTGLDDDHSAADLLTLDTTEEETSVVTGLGRVQFLLESFEAGNDGLDGVGLKADELDFVTLLQHSALDTSGGDSTTSGDRENV